MLPDLARTANAWSFCTGGSGGAGSSVKRMRISMPQNAPGSLSRQQNSDILAFVLYKSNFPAGATELPTQTEVLNTIKFMAMKPAQ